VLAADYVLERVRAAGGHIWYQGRRAQPLPLDAQIDDPSLRLIAEHRLWQLGELEARGLVFWAAGARDAELYRRLLEPRELVELQANGRRCVALLDCEDGLEFALHDLRHLEKFFDPAHHRAQVGFFRVIARGLAHPASEELDRALDDIWCGERDRVLADMNGSPIFLFAILKMKLKVAVRRRLAREAGVEPKANGALDDRELEAYAGFLERWLDALALEGAVRDAARAISARRDHPDNAKTLLAYFSNEAR
jgi:hypothetical protein